MGVDFKPAHEEQPLNPISRKQWDVMDSRDRAEFARLGGRLYDEPSEEKKEGEVITSLSGGKTVTSGEWDAMTDNQRTAFING